MPLTLCPPGSRKGNRFWIARGTVCGRRVEVSTGTTDKIAAKRFAVEAEREIEREIAESRVPSPGAVVTFAKAARHFEAFRWPGGTPKDDARRLAGLVREIGQKPVGDIVQADLVAAAEALKPIGSPATRNREVITPASAVLHYAADNGWCLWKRIKRHREPKPKTRAVDFDTAAALIGAADGKQRLLLLWLFKQGDRISDALSITWEMIDLTAGTVSHRQGKTENDRVAPLDDELVVALANEPGKNGRLFPWRTKSGVYKWLRPLAKGLGITFTPHMARHSVGTWFSAEGAGLRTIMEKLGHSDAKSSLRYQAGDIEVVRQVQNRLRTFAPGDKLGVKSRKARKS